MIKDELLNLVGELDGSPAERVLHQALRHQGILPSEPTLGPRKLQKRIESIPESALNSESVHLALAETQQNLRTIYLHTNIRVYLAFCASLVCGLATVALALWVLWYMIVRGAKLDQLKAISGFLSAILSGGCFWLYRRERIGLDQIERAMSRVVDFGKSKQKLANTI
jgi:hypothetical protein